MNVKRYNESLKLNEINDLSEILSYKLNNIKISKDEITKINRFLIKNSFNLEAKSLLNFCLASIKLRENSKFIFTRSLSDMLELIKKFGKIRHFDPKDLALFNINQILTLKNKMKKNPSSKNGTISNFNYDEKSKLPYLITNKNDFFIASNLLTKPNFITKKVVKARSQFIGKSQIYESLKNKIILIENADPGYDWIFSKKIKALVTKYGGVNSHMSIRWKN